MYGYNPQISIDRINNQIAELEKMKQSIPQPPTAQPAINQTFQLAPTNRDVIKYAASLEEVQRDMVIGDTPYFSKDMSVVWIKNTKNEIKTYELKEIIPLDEKDMQIQYLQSQIEELKGMISNEQYDTNNVAESNETSTPKDDGSTRTTTKKSKSSSISRVSTSKTE